MTVFQSISHQNNNWPLNEILDYFGAFLNPRKGILIKPNIVFPVDAKSGQITDPQMVCALIEGLRLRFKDIPIMIGEGTAAGTNPEENFIISGFSDLARRLEVDLCNFDHCERISIPWKYGFLDLPKAAFDQNVINLPILKMSAAATISAAIKNLKGFLLPEDKKRFHRLGLHLPLAYLSQIIRPQLTIVDCSRFFENRLLMAGDNPCEIDWHLAKTLGIEPPEYLQLARNLEPESNLIHIEGSQVLLSRHKSFEHKRYHSILGLRLWANPRACSMCRLQMARITKSSPLDMIKSMHSWLRLARRSIRGTDLLFGSMPVFIPGRRNIVCIGDCTRHFATENNYAHVPGCPPSYNEIMAAL